MSDLSLRDGFDHLVGRGVVTDKGTAHSYIQFYEDLLKPYRDQAIHVLEVGVFEGASLALWRDYFPKARITGVDIVPNPNPTPGTDFVMGDCLDPATFSGLPSIDIVIDDATHICENIVATFKVLRPLMNPGGLYVVEDIQDDDTVEQMQALAQFEVHDRRSILGRPDDRLLVWRSDDL